MADSFGLNLSWFSNSSTAAWQQTAGTAKKTIADFLDPTQKTAVQALWQDRVKQIVTNLNTGLKNDPNLFSNLDTFKNAYWYNQADAGKRAILDAYILQNKPDLNTVWTAPVAAGWVSNTQVATSPALTEITPLQQVELGTSTVKWTNIVAPSTGNTSFDAVGKRQLEQLMFLQLELLEMLMNKIKI